MTPGISAFLRAFYRPIMELVNSNRMVTRAATSAQRVFEVLDTPPEIYSTSHDYPERTVQLHFFECRLEGEPAAQIGQELRWVPRAALSSLSFPPADHQLIERLSR